MDKIDFHKIKLKLAEAFDRLGYFGYTEDWDNLTDSGRWTIDQARIQIGDVLSELYAYRGHVIMPELNCMEEIL